MPATWRDVLEELAPVFARRSTYRLFAALVCWYAISAYSTADVGRRRRLCPRYRTKTEPSPTDLLARLRREFLKARFSAIRPGRDANDQIDLEGWTCDSTAA
jgi:hypothetical protein